MVWTFVGVMALLAAGGLVGLVVDASTDPDHRLRPFLAVLIIVTTVLAIIGALAETQSRGANTADTQKPRTAITPKSSSGGTSPSPIGPPSDSAAAKSSPIQKFRVNFATLCAQDDTVITPNGECKLDDLIRDGTFTVEGRLQTFSAEAGAENHFVDTYTFAKSTCRSVHLRFAEGAEDGAYATLVLRISQSSLPQKIGSAKPGRLGRLDAALDGGPWALGVYTPTPMGNFGGQAAMYIDGFATCSTIDGR